MNKQSNCIYYLLNIDTAKHWGITFFGVNSFLGQCGSNQNMSMTKIIWPIFVHTILLPKVPVATIFFQAKCPSKNDPRFDEKFQHQTRHDKWLNPFQRQNQASLIHQDRRNQSFQKMYNRVQSLVAIFSTSKINIEMLL